MADTEHMTRARTQRLARPVGLLLGLALAALLATGLDVAAGTGTARTDVTFSATSSGELEVGPTGPFLRLASLEPGDEPREAALEARNQTGETLPVHVRALPSTPDLDGLLRVRLMAEGSVLFDGTLGELRDWTDRTLPVASGTSAALEVSAWLPPTAEGWQGRVVDVPLELGRARDS